VILPDVTGMTTPQLRAVARSIGTSHPVALELWATGDPDRRHLAAMIEDPHTLSEAQMDAWAAECGSASLCDACCHELFRKSHFAHRKCFDWASRREEFVKRAAFILMACLAINDKKAPDEIFEGYLPVIRREASDERPHVQRAIASALKQIGRRSHLLHRHAVTAAKAIGKMPSATAKEIALDAIEELESDAVIQRLRG
jgi:3-methyladenine DNA glycosylase AlkD